MLKNCGMCMEKVLKTRLLTVLFSTFRVEFSIFIPTTPVDLFISVSIGLFYDFSSLISSLISISSCVLLCISVSMVPKECMIVE